MAARKTPRAPRSSPRARAKTVSADTPLTELEERFCREYLVDMVAGAAYHRARPQVTQGSAWTLGAAMLLKPNVSARVAALQAERAARTRVDADLVVRKLRRNGEKAYKAEDYSASNKAWELLGKHLGMFTEKVEHSGEVRGAVVLLPPVDAAPAPRGGR